MVQRIKIISNTSAGTAVMDVNRLLADGWQILGEHVVSEHRLTVSGDHMGNPALVACYVVFLTREDRET